MKTIYHYLLLVCLSMLLVPFASAQSAVDFNVGVGTAYAKSSGESINTFGDGFYRTPRLDGVFMGAGGSVMLTKKFGFGMETTFQPVKRDYAGLKARTMFWDASGIYQPFSTKRAALQLKAGIGGVNMRFYDSFTDCNRFTGCFSDSQYLDSSNHFQVRGGAGVQVYLTDHIFVRPQLDLRYVPNFFQYGSNFVPGATVWVGYSLGER